jgi:hypothetical protein
VLDREGHRAEAARYCQMFHALSGPDSAIWGGRAARPVVMAARDLRRATIWSVVFEAVQPLIMIRRHVAKAVDRVHYLSM